MSYQNPFRKHRSRLSTPVRLGVAAVAACFIAAPVLSNPVNPTVVNGAASFNQAGNVLTVTNGNGAIINWDKFSIRVGETTNFIQTSASSSVLNRVLSDPTAIYGTLSSNGRVWLVNPAGILVGPSGRIDTAGFVASTLAVSNENFLAGRHLFINDGSAKDVINQGEIRTPAGGSVYLIGSNVSNEGIITTPNGETILAAGATVSLIDSATPGVKVDITGAEGNATNLGAITAEAGRIGIAGVIVRNSGTLNASSVVSEGGRIFLKASQDAYVDGNGRIVTTGTRGGSVEVLGNRVAVMDNAEIDASGANGGGRIMVGGDYQGKNPDIQNASITYFGPDATLKADATGVGDGGTVIVWADDTTRAYGNISARGGALGGNGGFVETSGKNYLSVDGIRVDTRAPLGLVGTWLLDPSNLTIWNGAGAGGNYSVSYGGDIFTTTNDPATIYGGTIETALLSTSVILQTDGGTGGNGNITATGVSISSGTASSLTLAAYGGGSATDGNITITGSIFSVYGGVNMLAGWNGGTFTRTDVIGGRGDITISGSQIWSTGGAVNLWAGKNITLSNSGSFGTWIQGATMDVAAGHDLSMYGGSGDISSSPGNGVMLYSTGMQTVTVGNQILLQAGSANNTVYGGGNMNGGGVGIWSDADQTISANIIKVYAGAGGHDNGAGFHAYGGQTINITGIGGLLELKGGGSAGSYNNQARIEHGQWYADNLYNGTGDQTITIYGGGSVNLQAGSGNGVLGYYSSDCWAATGGSAACRGSSNDAAIYNGVGNQTLSFVSGGSLTITGGSAGTQNWAGVNNQLTAAAQNINGDPNITVTGGSGGGSELSYGGNTFQLSNDAGINNKGSGNQTIYANSITLNAGNAAYGGGGISTESTNPAYINTVGDLSMFGGSSSSADPLGFGSPVYIGNKGGGAINLNIGGNLYIQAGSGTSSPAVIGTIDGPGNVSINTGGNVTIIAAGSPAGMGSLSTSYGASVTINSGGNLTVTDSATRGVMIGSLSDQWSPTQVTLTAQKDITLGSAGGYGVLIGVRNPWGNPSSGVTVVAGSYSVGSYLFTDPSPFGGNLLLNKSAAIGIGYGSGQVALGALQRTAGNGNITQNAGSIIYGGSVWFDAEGGATFNGSMTASTGYIHGSAGISCPDGCWSSTYGGSLSFGSSSIVSARNDIVLESSRDITVNGQMSSSNGAVTIAAGGYRGYSGIGYQSSPLGGNVVIGGHITGNNIDISANVGYDSPYGNGNVTQNSGSSIVANNNISIVAGGSASLGGTVSSDWGSLSVRAGYQGGYLSGVTPQGGNITVAGVLSGYFGVDLSAERGSLSGLKGDITQSAGSINSADGAIGIIGGGNVTLNGSVTADGAEGYGPITVKSGFSSYDGAPTSTGGNISLAGTVSGYSGVSLSAEAGSPSTGNITQSAGSITATSGNVTIIGGSSVGLNGGVSAPGYSVSVTAGVSPYWSTPSGYGGNISLGSGSSITGNSIDLTARSGSNVNGDIVQAAGGAITITGAIGSYSSFFKADGDLKLDGSVSMTSASGGYLAGYAGFNGAPGKTLRAANISSPNGGYVYMGSSGDAQIGSINAPGATVNIWADGSIYDNNGPALNISADTIYLSSQYGGAAGGPAISMDTSATSRLESYVAPGATNGGISIRNQGAAPGTINLRDYATYGAAVGFYNSGDLALDVGSRNFDAGSGDIFVASGGSLSGVSNSPFGGTPANLLLVAAGGDMTFAGPLSSLGNIGLVASGLMNIDQPVSGNNVAVAGGTTTISGGGSVCAANDAIVLGSTINLISGGYIDGTNVFLGGGTLNLNGQVYASGQLEFNLASVNAGYGGGLFAYGLASNITGVVSGNILLDDGAFFRAGNDVNLTFTGGASTISLSNVGYVLANSPDTIALAFSARTSGGVMIDGVETIKSVADGSGFFVLDHQTPAAPGAGLEITYASNGVTDLCALSPALCKPPEPEIDPCVVDPTLCKKPDGDKDKKTHCEEGDFGCEQDQTGNKDDKPPPKKLGQCSL